VSPRSHYATFYLGFAVFLVALHVPYLRMPFHWDEMGQFVPAALDLFRDGAWVPHSTLANVHPPGVMAVLALVWRAFGYSILSARLTMLAIAAFAVLCAFLLAIRLSRQASLQYRGMPAFAAVLLLIASPLFHAQSMLVLLDLPAMSLTALALLLFLNARYAACAAAATALVLTKETALTTPLFFAAWLWFHDGKRREALYFAAPAAALAVWLVVLRHSTGHWLGNAEFARYNVSDALSPLHILATLVRRVWFLFVSDGHFLGTLAIFLGRRILRGRDWNIALGVAAAQVAAVTLFGGAGLERYLLPALPVLYAAVAAAALVYPVRWRTASHAAMAALLVLGWVWNPPYPFPLENNLAMTDFTGLQKDAAAYLQAYAPDRRIATTWPFTDALEHPEFGYVERPQPIVKMEDFTTQALSQLDPASYDLLVVYPRDTFATGSPSESAPVREFLRRYYSYHPPPTEDEIRTTLGLSPMMRIQRRGLWIEIYARDYRAEMTGPATTGPARYYSPPRISRSKDQPAKWIFLKLFRRITMSDAWDGSSL